MDIVSLLKTQRRAAWRLDALLLTGLTISSLAVSDQRALIEFGRPSAFAATPNAPAGPTTVASVFAPNAPGGVGGTQRFVPAAVGPTQPGLLPAGTQLAGVGGPINDDPGLLDAPGAVLADALPGGGGTNASTGAPAAAGTPALDGAGNGTPGGTGGTGGGGGTAPGGTGGTGSGEGGGTGGVGPGDTGTGGGTAGPGTGIGTDPGGTGGTGTGTDPGGTGGTGTGGTGTDPGGTVTDPGGTGGDGTGTGGNGTDVPPVTAIPEPSTWALLTLAFGVVGVSLRRQRRRSRRTDAHRSDDAAAS